VDGVGTVRRFESDGGEGRMLEIAPPVELSRYIAAKGSIAVDGISLTVAGLLDESFTIAIIPHTLQHTNLSQVRAGSRVNLEVDVLARYVERLMSAGSSGQAAGGLSLESLRNLGY
jgi:riboflavin synthase